MLKKILCGILIVLSLSMSAGCKVTTDGKIVLGDGDGKASQVNEMALQLMEEKYGEVFNYCAPAGSSYTGTRRFSVTCDSLPDRRIYVQIERYQYADRTFSDNYCAVKYADKIKELLQQAADSKFDEAKVYYDPTGKPHSPNFDNNTTFEEYLADENTWMSVVIGIKQSDYIDVSQIESLVSELDDVLPYGTIHILFYAIADNMYIDADEDAFRTSGVNDTYYVRATLDRVDSEWSKSYKGIPFDSVPFKAGA